MGQCPNWHTLDPLVFCECWAAGIHKNYCFQLIVITKGDLDGCSNIFRQNGQGAKAETKMWWVSEEYNPMDIIPFVTECHLFSKTPYSQSLDMSDTNVSHILTKIIAKDRKRERRSADVLYESVGVGGAYHFSWSVHVLLVSPYCTCKPNMINVHFFYCQNG